MVMTELLPHAESADQVLDRFQSRRDGLSDEEAARRLEQVGPNTLEATKPVSALTILRDQLRSVVVALLVAAAAIALMLGERIEASAIAAVLVINTVIGFLTEWHARRAMAALRQFDVPPACAGPASAGGRSARLDDGDLYGQNTDAHLG